MVSVRWKLYPYDLNGGRGYKWFISALIIYRRFHPLANLGPQNDMLERTAVECYQLFLQRQGQIVGQIRVACRDDYHGRLFLSFGDPAIVTRFVDESTISNHWRSWNAATLILQLLTSLLFVEHVFIGRFDVCHWGRWVKFCIQQDEFTIVLRVEAGRLGDLSNY